MKKVGIIVVALIGILIIAALVAPSFIDWNRYKPEIAEAVKEATGRDLDIRGDISLSILPTPSVSVEDLRLSNIRGAKNPEMLSLKRARVDVGLMALISGNVQVRTVEFIDPVINIERLESGKGNWEFKPEQADGEPAGAAPPDGRPRTQPAEPRQGQKTGEEAQPFALSLDEVLIRNGTVVYTDHATGESQRLENINGTFMAASLQGPFEADGDMMLRGQRISYELSLSEIIKGRTAQLRLKVGFPPSDGFVQISGSFANVQQAPTLRGKVQVRADNLASLLAAATGTAAQPGVLAQKFSLDTQVTADMKRIQADEVRLALGPSRARGNVAVTLADVTDVKAELAFGHVDLDAWLASMKSAAKREGGGENVKKKDNGTGIVVPLKKGDNANRGEADGFSLPADITAALSITADALTYNKQPIRQVKVDGGLKGGVISISDVSALLPGNGQFNANGTVRSAKGQPQLAGDVRLNVRDLRAMMAWLALEMEGLPPDRLRTLTVAGNLAGRPDSIRVVGLQGRLDNVTFGGSLGADMGATTVLRADLEVDRLNVDAYLPSENKAKGKGTGGGKAGADARRGGAPEFEGIEGLKDLDADVRFQAGELIYQGKSAKSVLVDVRLKNGDAVFKTARVSNLAGNSITLKGGLKGLATDGLPEPDNLVITSEMKDPPALFALAGQETPELIRKLGAIGLNVTVNGSLSRPALQGTVQAGGATASFNGTVEAFAATPVMNMNLTLTHPDLNTLLRLAGSDYRPKGPGISQVRLTGTIAGSADKMKITGLDVQTGGARITGTVDANMSGEKAVIAANLATNALEIERFMPADDGGRAGDDADTGIELAQAGDGQAVGGRVHPRWSREPLDLAALDEMIVDATVKSEAVIYAGTRIDNVDTRVSVKDGAARVEKFDGSLGGGPVAMTAELVAGAPHRFRANLSVEKGRFSADFGKGRGASRANGILDLLADVTANGRSEADLVKALNGDGNLAVSRLDVKGEGSGGGLAALYKLVAMLNSIGGPLSGGKGLAEMSANFDIRRGVTTIRDGRLSAGPYKGTVGGIVDLPAWVMDIEGEAVRQDQSVGGAVLRGLEGLNLGGVRVQVPKNLPFRISGPVDEPNVNVQTGRRTQPSQPADTAPQQQQQQQQQQPAPQQQQQNLFGIPVPGQQQPQQQQAPSQQQQDQLPLEQQAPSEQQVPLEEQEPATQDQQQQDGQQRRQQERQSPEQQLKRLFGL